MSIAMTLYLSLQRVLRNVRATRAPSSLLPLTHQRSAWFWNRDKKEKPEKKLIIEPNPLAAENLTRKPPPPKLARGSLAESSILEDEEIAGPKLKGVIDNDARSEIFTRNPAGMAAVLDPAPEARRRWERKMVIRKIRKRGRLTKAQELKQQEREITSKSHDFKTSVKKLVHLANQIKGKTVEDAIIQMRFSKKKVAKEVKQHLEHAKNEAIVRRGMGIGLATGQNFTPLTIMTNDKKRVKVTDPSTIYVDQAWCIKGLYEKSYDFRARGKTNILRHRTTSMTLVLKEESTRIRINEERQKKEAKRRIWVQLPNRKVTAQRPYYCW